MTDELCLKTATELDLGLRDVSGMDSDTFITRYCEVFREHAYATQDGGINEFEKLITHVLGMKIHYSNITKLLGLADGDVFALEEILRHEASSEVEPDDEFTQLRNAVQGHILRVEDALADNEQYNMLEDVELRSLAKAVVMFHLFKD